MAEGTSAILKTNCKSYNFVSGALLTTALLPRLSTVAAIPHLTGAVKGHINLDPLLHRLRKTSEGTCPATEETTETRAQAGIARAIRA